MFFVPLSRGRPWFKKSYWDGCWTCGNTTGFLGCWTPNLRPSTTGECLMCVTFSNIDRQAWKLGSYVKFHLSFLFQSTDFRSLFHPQQPWRHLETKSLVSEAGWQPWTWTFWGARWPSQRTQNDGLGPRGNQRKIPGVDQCHILVTLNNTFFQLNCAWKMAQDLGWAVKL